MKQKVKKKMDRNSFNQQMNDMLNGTTIPITYEEQINILHQSINSLDSKQREIFSGFHNTVIVIEELAELTKELTKALRNKDDIIGILEELADVSIGVDYVKEIFDITDKELEYARSIKMTELQKKFNSQDYS